MWNRFQRALEKSPVRLLAFSAALTFAFVEFGLFVLGDRTPGSSYVSVDRKGDAKPPFGSDVVFGHRRSDRSIAEPQDAFDLAPAASDGAMAAASADAADAIVDGSQDDRSSRKPVNDWKRRDALVQEGLRRLKRFPIFHNNPTALPWRKSTKIVLKIGSKDRESARKAADLAYGGLASANIDLGMEVRAELYGSEHDVAIQKVEPSIRSVSEASNTTWEWFVIPKTTEPFEMTMRLFNRHEVDGNTIETEGPAYTHTFTVEVSTWQRIEIWLSKLNAWLTMLGISIVAMFGWAFRQFRERRSSKPDNPARGKHARSRKK